MLACGLRGLLQFRHSTAAITGLSSLTTTLVRNAGRALASGPAAGRSAVTMPRNKAPRWRWCIGGVGIGMVTVAIGKLLTLAPSVAERPYVLGPGRWFTQVLSAITGSVPFSAAEILLALFLCWPFLPAVPAVIDSVRRRRSAGNVVACGFARTTGTLGLVVASFYLVWGFNYARAPLPLRQGWDDTGLPVLPRLGTANDRDELVTLCTELVFLSNHYYTVATGTPESLRRSELPCPVQEIDHSLDTGFIRASGILGLGDAFAAARGPAKPIFASRLMSKLGVAGFYAPWTGEANYNAEIPPFQLPLTIAHEKAHQRGIASEDEANFFGFLACGSTDDPYARYAGYLFAQRQLLNELIQIDPPAARTIIALRCKGVQSDVIYSKVFWRILGGRAQSLGHTINDAYLKANRVQGGALSYQMSARLLILFARQNGGTLTVPLASTFPHESG